MGPQWKQFEELDTDSGNNVFLKARLRLTAVYVLIVAVIILGFSIFLYQSIGRNLKDVSDDDFGGRGPHQHFVDSTLPLVEEEILLADLFILVVSAGVSYLLAGYTLRPIQQSVEVQKAFSENASHELRTPLAVMKNDIEVLLRNPSPTKDLIHRTLESNIEEIDRMTKMAEDLLALARSERRIAPDAEHINISELAEKMVAKMHPLAAAKHLQLKAEVHAHLFVRGNASGLEHIFLNLLQNAIEHTGERGSIQVELRTENSEAIITIADTGSGIDEKDLPHLFERFYKGESASGTGLGLSIVKELVSQHEGSITIESTKGKGTVARVVLPLVV